MSSSGPLDHVDLSVSAPERSIPFYHALLYALDFQRRELAAPEFSGPNPSRAVWERELAGGARFEIEVRPALGADRHKVHDRYAPGLHHLAFHAQSREGVDRVHRVMVQAGAHILDPPTDYGGQPGYERGYYAVFFADPDGLKLEVVHRPRSKL